MATLSKTKCPKCGEMLVNDSEEGVCITCLGRFGLAPDAGDSSILRLGDYELLEEVARGGMGVVYRARQLSLNRIVAVKVVLHGPFSSPEFVRRFRNEAEATAKLRHPHIVSVFEVGEYNGHHFLSMEFVEGRNLAELIREQPLSALRAAGYVKTIAEAVNYAHQRGVLHRDLKPSNVLVDIDDQPRVTDFGLAKILERDAGLTLTGEVLGSPNHMAPEQAAGDFSKSTARSDIYSIGSILYQLITSRAPFQGGTLGEILAQVQTAEPVPPRRLNPSIPVDLQSICLKCLQKEPARRYATALELAKDLGRFIELKPVSARPISLVERSWFWCRRRPLLAGLSLALALAILSGLAVSLWQWQRADLHARGEMTQRLAAEENAATTRLELYAADIGYATSAIQDGDYGLARRTLDNLRPKAGEKDLRGFEWRYLWNLVQGDQLATLPGHQWIVTCAAFSPDGKQVVSGGMGGELRVWDVSTRSCLHNFKPDPETLWSLTYTPDGKTLMIAGKEGIQFWNVENWKCVRSFPGSLASLARDGTTVAISESRPFASEEDGPVTIWNWRTGEKLRVISPQGRVSAFSPDGRTLALAERDSGISLFNLSSGALLKALPTDKLVWSLNFSPDGKRLAAAGWCGKALVWDLAANSPPGVISTNNLNLWTILFSPDGSNIVTTSSDQSVRLWDALTLQPKTVLHGHASEVWCAAYSADGKMLVTGGKDQNVMLWLTSAPNRPQTLPHDNYFRPLFSTDGKLLVTTKPDSEAASQLWNAETLATLAASVDNGAEVRGFSQDGKCVLLFNAAEMTLEFWPVGGETFSLRVPLAEAANCQQPYGTVGVSPGQDFFFVSSADGTIYIWSTSTGKLQGKIKGPPPPVRSIVLGPRAEKVAVSIESENTARLYDCATGVQLPLAGHKDFVSNMAFSPDGAVLATGSEDGTIRLWNTADGSSRAVLPGHMQETTDVAFSPDGRTLASLSQGESLKLWHLPTLRQVYSLKMANAGMWLRFSPDGSRLAISMLDNQLTILEAPFH